MKAYQKLEASRCSEPDPRNECRDGTEPQWSTSIQQTPYSKRWSDKEEVVDDWYDSYLELYSRECVMAAVTAARYRSRMVMQKRTDEETQIRKCKIWTGLK